MTRRTLIVNPYASRITEQRIAEVEDRLRPVEVLRTERRGHATELARGAAGDEVWVLGGDGVVNEALNGIRDGVALGIVPAGGANVVARALGARERRISVGRVNGRRFAFSAGIGVDSEVVRELETRQRAQSGRRSSNLQYGRAVAGRLFRGSEPRLEVVGQGRAAAVFVANDAVYTYAGPLPLRFLPRRPVRAGPRLRRARSRDAALVGEPVHSRAGGPRDGRCVGRPQRPRPRPHRGSLRRPAAAPGGRRRPRRRAAKPSSRPSATP